MLVGQSAQTKFVKRHATSTTNFQLLPISIAFFWLLCSMPPAARGQENELSKAEVVDLLRAAENSVVGLSYHFALSSPGDTGVEGKVLWDPATGRHKFEGTSVTKWVNGAADKIATRLGVAFDGVFYQTWEHEQHGKNPPPVIQDKAAGIVGVPMKFSATKPFGEIDTKKYFRYNFSSYKHAAGIRYLPPFLPTNLTRFLSLEQDTKPSTFIENAEEKGLTTSSREDGRFIRLVLTRPSVPVGRLTCEFDLGNAGLITKLNYQASINGEKSMALFRHEIRFDVTGKVPILLQSSRMGKEESAIVLANFRFVDAFAEDDFKLRFPPGTSIRNRFLGQSYRVEEGATKSKQFPEMEEFVTVNKSPPNGTIAYSFFGEIMVTVVRDAKRKVTDCYASVVTRQTDGLIGLSRLTTLGGEIVGRLETSRSGLRFEIVKHGDDQQIGVRFDMKKRVIPTGDRALITNTVKSAQLIRLLATRQSGDDPKMPQAEFDYDKVKDLLGRLPQSAMKTSNKLPNDL
jgi:hypothetical protein